MSFLRFSLDFLVVVQNAKFGFWKAPKMFSCHYFRKEEGEKKDTKISFLDLAVAKSLQSTRTVTDAADDADDVLTTTGYTC